MTQSLTEELKVYFSSKEHLTEEERGFLGRLKSGFFTITSVHRNDLDAKGFDTDRITDENMRALAQKMADDYCEQLFWDSMEIIAGDILGFPRKKDGCPRCGASISCCDMEDSGCRCKDCGLGWNDQSYVLVEFPQDSGYFEDEDIGFPSLESRDNGARYVPEAEYIRHFRQVPDRSHCFRAVSWPESQTYMDEAEKADSRCEAILDETALEMFGTSAYWVPLSLYEKKTER